MYWIIFILKEANERLIKEILESSILFDNHTNYKKTYLQAREGGLFLKIIGLVSRLQQ